MRETDAQKNWNDYWKSQGVQNRPKKSGPGVKFLVFLLIIVGCVGVQIMRDGIASVKRESGVLPGENNISEDISQLITPEKQKEVELLTGGTLDHMTGIYLEYAKAADSGIRELLDYTAVQWTNGGNPNIMEVQKRVNEISRVVDSMESQNTSSAFRDYKLAVDQNDRALLDVIENMISTGALSKQGVMDLLTQYTEFSSTRYNDLKTLLDSEHIFFTETEEDGVNVLHYRYRAQ